MYIYSLSIHLTVGFLIFYLFIYLYLFFRAAPEAYGGSQARGLIRAVATSLRQSHSNAGSEPRLQPTPQLTATPDGQPTERGQGSDAQRHGSQSDSFPPRHDGNSSCSFLSEWCVRISGCGQLGVIA